MYNRGGRFHGCPAVETYETDPFGVANGVSTKAPSTATVRKVWINESCFHSSSHYVLIEFSYML